MFGDKLGLEVLCVDKSRESVDFCRVQNSKESTLDCLDGQRGHVFWQGLQHINTISLLTHTLETDCLAALTNDYTLWLSG